MDLTVDEVLKEFQKQSDFLLELFADKRISQEIKNEYAKKYNNLKIKDYSVKNV